MFIAGIEIFFGLIAGVALLLLAGGALLGTFVGVGRFFQRLAR